MAQTYATREVAQEQTYATEDQEKTMVGQWVIIDPKNPHVVEVGRFAVDEHNRQAHTHLEFIKVLEAESQVVAGVKYRLLITASDGHKPHNYQAVVLEKPWASSMTLLSFKQLLL